MTEQEKLEQAIANLEAQRAILGDAVVETAVQALKEKIANLKTSNRPEHRKRKIASVLFADISGFTAMSERMDAEDVSDLVNSLWERIDQLIIEHGGRIDKHIGDAVMALWGTETAREDDPERAVRAALAIQAELGAIQSRNELADARFGEEASQLSLRIAVHTGPVLLGQTGTTGEYTAIGDTVNTASRLQHLAPVGGVVISAATALHVQGLFDLQALKPLKAKGKSEPLRVYLALRPRPRSYLMQTRGLEGVSTPLVGRETELKQLQDLLDVSIQTRTCQMVTISGEAGIGKSRLQYEFESQATRLNSDLSIFRGRTNLDMMNQHYALLRDLFSNAFQIQESDPLRVVWEKFVRGVTAARKNNPSSLIVSRRESTQPVSLQMQAHFIGQLLGFNFSASPYLKNVLQDARQLHDRAMIYLIEFFRAAAERSPLVIFLDDLHWADESSLDTIIYLFRALNGLPVMFMCMTRPTLFERRAAWGQGKGQTQLKLHPLSTEASQQLVEEILQKLEYIPDHLSKLIVDGSDGNPYYIEELVKMLIENRVIIQEGERWQIDLQRLHAEQVPPTLVGILQARLDSLSAPERAILQCSSVVGYTFWDQAVQTISPGEKAELENTLTGLHRRELILPSQASAFMGSKEYSFKHTMLHSVTYESVLKSTRRQYHTQVAHWLTAQQGERVAEFSGLIADHLEKAGQMEQAIMYLRRAGDQACQTFANAEGLQYYSRALDLLKEDNYQAAYALRLARESLYDLLGEREAQEKDLDALTELADRFGFSQQAEVAIRRANLHLVTGNYAAGLKAARQAIDCAENSGDSSSLASALVVCGQALWRSNQRKEAHPLFIQALELARTSQQAQVEADTLRMLGNLAYDQDLYEEARQYFEQSLDICRQTGNRRSECSVLNDLGILLNRTQRASEAGLACYQEALQVAREIGDRHMESTLLINLGIAYRGRGEYSLAIQSYEEASQIQEEIDDPLHQSATLINLSILLKFQGKHIKALHLLEQALEIKQRIGDQRGESIALAGISLLWNYLGQYEQAEACLQRVLKIKQSIGERRGEMNAFVNLADTALGRGDVERSLQYAQQAITLAEELKVPQYASDCLLGLGEALFASHRYIEAAECFRKAMPLLREANEQEDFLISQSRLALALLADGQTNQARTEIDSVFKQVEAISRRSEHRGSIPVVVYLAGYRIYTASHDPHAQQILVSGYELLMQKTDQIEDADLRRSFLENVATNRELVEEYERRMASEDAVGI